MLTEKQLATIRTFIERSKKPLFFFDDDPDGLCSYLLFKRKYNKGLGYAVKVKAGEEANRFYLNQINKNKPDLLFFLDRPVLDQDFIDQVNVPIIWIDHHQPIERQNVNYFNPMVNQEGDNRPTSYWTYKVVNNKEDLWIGLIGVIADWHIPEFLKDFKHKELLDNKKSPPEVIFESRFGRLIKSFAFVLKGKSSDTKKCIKILETIKDPREILDKTTQNGKYIYEKYASTNKEYEALLKRALKNETDSDLFLFIYPSTKNSFTSMLSNELLHRLNNKLILVGREKGNDIKLSLRSKFIKVLPILQKALEGVRGYGGGHMFAVGANIHKDDFPKFIRIIEEELKSN